MKGKRNARIYVLGSLVLSICALTIGFAAFSNTLKIASRASVTPNSSDFSVVFSSNGTEYKTDPVVGTKSNEAITLENGIIDNTTNPTITNLHATFTNPGQSATYTFYVHNNGQYLAHLNSITLVGRKSCTPEDKTYVTQAAVACNDVTVTVDIGSLSVTETTQDIQNETLAVGEFKQVTVTIAYASNATEIDTPIDMLFPNISLYYSTVPGSNEEYVAPKAYLTSFSSSNYFKESAYKKNIKNVYFVDYVDTNGAVKTYDLSENKDESITGWIVTNNDDTSKYDLYIGSDKEIYTKNFAYAFDGMMGIEKIQFSNLNTSENTSFLATFRECLNLTTLDLRTFDTSKVTKMDFMFDSCNNLTALDVSNWNTSKVTNMDRMFYSCSSLTTLDVSNFDTSKVTNMDRMFYNCNSLTTLDVSHFDTSKVTNMDSTFYNCESLTTLDVSHFDTSKVTKMDYIFSSCDSLTTLDVSNFDTSNVTSMPRMFYFCNSLTTLDVSNFDTSNVTNMDNMFYNCKSLTTLDVSNFDTSNVTRMPGMFYNCDSLTTLDVSNFDTSKVTKMDSIFRSCDSLTTLDVSNFDTSNVTNMANMFYFCKSLTTLYASNKFTTSAVTNSASMFSGCTNLVGGAGTKYDKNKTDKTYARIDGGTSNPGYFTAKS